VTRLEPYGEYGAASTGYKGRRTTHSKFGHSTQGVDRVC